MTLQEAQIIADAAYNAWIAAEDANLDEATCTALYLRYDDAEVQRLTILTGTVDAFAWVMQP